MVALSTEPNEIGRLRGLGEEEAENDMEEPGWFWLLVLGIVALELVQLSYVWPLPRQETMHERRECNRGEPAPDDTQESKDGETSLCNGARSALDGESRDTEVRRQPPEVHAVS